MVFLQQQLSQIAPFDVILDAAILLQPFTLQSLGHVLNVLAAHLTSQHCCFACRHEKSICTQILVNSRCGIILGKKIMTEDLADKI